MPSHQAIRTARALGPTALYLYATLIELAGRQGRTSRCETTNTELAALCDVTERTIQRTLIKLQEEGLITCPFKGNGRGLQSLYDIVEKGDTPQKENGHVDQPHATIPTTQRVTPSPAEDLVWLLNQPEIKAVKKEYSMTDALLRRSLKELVKQWQGVDRAGNPTRPQIGRTRVSRAVNWLRAGEREGGQHNQWRQEDPYGMSGVTPV